MLGRCLNESQWASLVNAVPNVGNPQSLAFNWVTCLRCRPPRPIWRGTFLRLNWHYLCPQQPRARSNPHSHASVSSDWYSPRFPPPRLVRRPPFVGEQTSLMRLRGRASYKPKLQLTFDFQNRLLQTVRSAMHWKVGNLALISMTAAPARPIAEFRNWGNGVMSHFLKRLNESRSANRYFPNRVGLA